MKPNNCDISLLSSKEIQRQSGQLTPHLQTLLSNDPNKFIQNIDTTLYALLIEGQGWAITENKKEYNNAIICSPYGTYVKYPIENVHTFKDRWHRCLIRVATPISASLYRLGQINRIVQVNNNLNSLIRHSPVFTENLENITDFLVERFPKNAIAFYRVNSHLDTDFLEKLKNLGYTTFSDRIAHVYFPNSGYMQKSHTRRDIALLRNSSYKLVTGDTLNEHDIARITDLYYQLFVTKHTSLNPIYTKEYFTEAVRQGWHDYVALRNEQGEIDAFISWFYDEGVMSCGPLGYDLSLDKKLGLYRQLVAVCLKHAHEKQLIFNMGSGSDEFKLNRGSTKTLENVAIYSGHLPKYRQWPWKLLAASCNAFIQRQVTND